MNRETPQWVLSPLWVTIDWERKMSNKKGEEMRGMRNKGPIREGFVKAFMAIGI